jgi:hypothetical protein
MTKYPTYFVDIDGTIAKYRKFSDLNVTNPEPIQSVIDKVNSEYDNGAHIVITTARPLDLEQFTKKELEVLGVKYHQIIFGLGRGTRYVINDKDPEYPDVDRAVGINLNRNEGLCM